MFFVFVVATFAIQHSSRINLAIGQGPTCTKTARFEGAEHRCLANFQHLSMIDTTNTTFLRYVNMSMDEVTFRAGNNVLIGTYGDVVAMAGDFFGPDTFDGITGIICQGVTEQDRENRFNSALATMDVAPIQGVTLIEEEFDLEIAAIKLNATFISWQVYREFSFAKVSCKSNVCI